MDLIFSPAGVALFTCAAVMVLVLSLQPSRAKVAVADRASVLLGRQAAKSDGAGDEPIAGSFFQRMVIPAMRRLLRLVGRLMPTNMVASTEEQLTVAGRPGGLTAAEFLGIRVVLIGLAAVAALVYERTNPSNPQLKMFAPIVLLAFSYTLPQSWLSGAARRRKDSIQASLPDALDMLTVCVEAGLAFESAMQRVSDQWHGPLSDEFARTVTEIRLGVQRAEALRRLAQRCDLADMQSFVAVLIQADYMGSSIAHVLRSQSDQMRVLRRQRAEEKARQAPIKMLIPMMVFIFPALFIAILGPAVPQLLQAFGPGGFGGR